MQVVQCVIFAVIASMHTGLICDGDAGDSGERTALNPWSGDSDIQCRAPSPATIKLHLDDIWRITWRISIQRSSAQS
jgi:hypothetical protein